MKCRLSQSSFSIAFFFVTGLSVICFVLVGCPPESLVLPVTYSVTYDANGATGGSSPTDTQSYQQGQTVTVLGNTGNLVNSGFAFRGWNTKADNSDIFYDPGQTFIIGSDNVTLYAVWTPLHTIVVGYVTDTSSSKPCYWEDGGLHYLPMGSGNDYGYAGIGPVMSMPIHTKIALDNAGNILIAGSVGITGYPPFIDSTLNPCYWENGTLTLLSTGSSSWGYSCSVALDSSGNIFVTGVVAADPHKPCYWDNGNINILDLGSSVVGFANDIAFSTEGHSYIAGFTEGGSPTTTTPCYWEDGILNALPLGPSDSQGLVFEVTLDNSGNIYVTGETGDSNGKPCYWKNGILNTLPMGSTDTNGSAFQSAFDSAGTFYVAGATGGSSFAPCYWKNGILMALPLGEGNTQGEASGLYIDVSGDIYITGTVGASNKMPCYWRNGDLTILPMGQGTDGQATGVITRP